jgi:hypothetical protein
MKAAEKENSMQQGNKGIVILDTHGNCCSGLIGLSYPIGFDELQKSTPKWNFLEADLSFFEEHRGYIWCMALVSSQHGFGL